jgi:hypothetical protein
MRIETETRWMVLGTDGRHVSLGCTAPSEAVLLPGAATGAMAHAALLAV